MNLRVAKNPGSKWRLAREIVARLPRRPVYVEPFFGSGAVLMAKPRWPSELINDLDGRVTALFRVLRDRPAELARAVALTPYSRREWEEVRSSAGDGDDGERGGDLEVARRFLVRGYMTHGNWSHGPGGWRHDGKTGRLAAKEWSDLPARIERAADRFRGVMIECRPAVEVIERFQGESVTIFADPPYPEYSAQGRRCRAYRHEMLDESDHRPLLEVLRAHRGPVVACSYRNALYDGALLGAGWEVVEFDARAEHGVERTEALYLNQAAVDARAQMELGGGMWGREGRPT